MAVIGVDFHTNSFTVCRLGVDGSEVFQTFDLSPQALEQFFQNLEAEHELTVDETDNAAWFCDEMRSRVGRMVMLNQHQCKGIRTSIKKTVRNDARALAFFLSKDMLSETCHRPTQESELASLNQTRNMLVKQHTMLPNGIRAMFMRLGMKLNKEASSCKKRLRELDISQIRTLEQIELVVLSDQTLNLAETLRRFDKATEEAASTMNGFEETTGIKGIGTRSAAALLEGIWTVEEFHNTNDVAAQFGTIPKLSRANETFHHGRITKRGNKLVRTTLVQCRLIAMHCSGYLNSHCQHIKEHSCADKVIIATACKLLSIIYNILKNGWTLDDFSNFQIKKNQCAA